MRAVSAQAIRAATENPVEALRYECHEAKISNPFGGAHSPGKTNSKYITQYLCKQSWLFFFLLGIELYRIKNPH